MMVPKSNRAVTLTVSFRNIWVEVSGMGGSMQCVPEKKRNVHSCLRKMEQDVYSQTQSGMGSVGKDLPMSELPTGST